MSKVVICYPPDVRSGQAVSAFRGYDNGSSVPLKVRTNCESNSSSVLTIRVVPPTFQGKGNDLFHSP